MFTDISDLRDFYETGLGRTVKRLLRWRVQQLWPDVTGMTVLGVGYAVPLLRPWEQQAANLIALMPAQQGIVHWPREGPYRAVLADEAALPFADCSMDRIILMHALECTESLRAMLEECWRVLAGTGRLLVIVPNRRGVWARLDSTPFGMGHPYSARQLRAVLTTARFTPLRVERALYLPPIDSRFLLRAAATFEGIGARCCPRLAGVVMVEACKQVYAIRPNAQRQRLPVRILPIPQLVPQMRPRTGRNGLDAGEQTKEKPDKSGFKKALVQIKV
jgi:SAM-dependent methyltransferase